MICRPNGLLLAVLASCLLTGAGRSADVPDADMAKPDAAKSDTADTPESDAPQSDTPKSGTPDAATTRPASGRLTRDQKVTNILDYLEKDYAKKAAAPYWVTRAMGVISLARSPRPTASVKLLELCDKDKHDVVRLLAWQALLARVDEMDAKTQTHWMNATLALAEKDAFHGALRIPLLNALSTAPMNARSKKVWEKIFTETSAWEPQDIPVLDALARCLSVWKSASVAEGLIKLYTDPNTGVRAEYVLHNAGCTAPTAREHLAPDILDNTAKTRVHPSSAKLWAQTQTEAAAWLHKQHADWKEGKAVDKESFKQLQPMYVGKAMALADVDPEDKFWTGDLELGRADVDQFEAVFVVDATGSMGDVLAWLRRDVARVMQAFTVICKEPPSLGVVFYRDHDDSFVTKTLPITTKLNDLAPGLMSMTADGGGDIPEAILEGLTVSVNQMKWGQGKRKGRMMILIGDAPPHFGTEAACEAMVKKGLDASGIKTYACKLTTVDGHNDLSEFDKIAAAGGGATVEADFGAIASFRILTADGKQVQLQTVERPDAQLIVAPASADQPPGEKILNTVLSDAINPQYRDRVLPLVQTLLAYCQAKSEPEQRKGFPADTPVLVMKKFDAQKK